MADQADIDRLRKLLGNVDIILVPDADLELYLDNNANSLNGAAYEYWVSVAASYVSLVDTSENQSSRKMSQAYDHAQKMIEFFRGLIDSEAVVRRSTTRAIVRP